MRRVERFQDEVGKFHAEKTGIGWSLTGGVHNDFGTDFVVIDEELWILRDFLDELFVYTYPKTEGPCPECGATPGCKQPCGRGNGFEVTSCA